MNTKPKVQRLRILDALIRAGRPCTISEMGIATRRRIVKSGQPNCDTDRKRVTGEVHALMHMGLIERLPETRKGSNCRPSYLHVPAPGADRWLKTAIKSLYSKP